MMKTVRKLACLILPVLLLCGCVQHEVRISPVYGTIKDPYTIEELSLLSSAADLRAYNIRSEDELTELVFILKEYKEDKWQETGSVSFPFIGKEGRVLVETEEEAVKICVSSRYKDQSLSEEHVLTFPAAASYSNLGYFDGTTKTYEPVAICAFGDRDLYGQTEVYSSTPEEDFAREGMLVLYLDVH